MSFTEDLINGLGTLMADNPDKTVPMVFRAAGNYAEGEFGIYAITAPLARDRSAVTIRAYDTVDDPSLSDSTISVQLDFYGSRVEVTRAVDEVFQLLHGFWSGTIGGIAVQTIVRTSGVILGIDEAGNVRQTENYDLAVHKPSTHRQ